MVVYLTGNTFCCAEGTALRVMVFSGRFEVYTLDTPPHRPVDTPWQLCNGGGAQVYSLFASAGIAFICYAPFTVPAQDCGGVLVAFAAEHGDRHPVVRQRSGAELIQDCLDHSAVLKSLPHTLGIAGCLII